MNFLSRQTLKAWLGTPFRKAQLLQLEEWGYKRGRDFWIRRDGTLAVKSQLLHSTLPVNEVTEPDFSSLAAKTENQ